jgi:hypothetical protein
MIEMLPLMMGDAGVMNLTVISYGELVVQLYASAIKPERRCLVVRAPAVLIE